MKTTTKVIVTITLFIVVGVIVGIIKLALGVQGRAVPIIDILSAGALIGGLVAIWKKKKPKDNE